MTMTTLDAKYSTPPYKIMDATIDYSAIVNPQQVSFCMDSDVAVIGPDYVTKSTALVIQEKDEIRCEMLACWERPPCTSFGGSGTVLMGDVSPLIPVHQGQWFISSLEEYGAIFYHESVGTTSAEAAALLRTFAEIEPNAGSCFFETKAVQEFGVRYIGRYDWASWYNEWNEHAPIKKYRKQLRELERKWENAGGVLLASPKAVLEAEQVPKIATWPSKRTFHGGGVANVLADDWIWARLFFHEGKVRAMVFFSGMVPSYWAEINVGGVPIFPHKD